MRYGETFAGLGLGSLAIKKHFPDAQMMFYSEIESHRCKHLEHHHRGVKNIGDIDTANIDNLPKIDLLIGGPPCKDLSIAKSNREGLEGYHSSLFFKYLEIVKEVKPKWFIMENVASMSKEARDKISNELGVKPVMISGKYFTGQARDRLYWCNFPILPHPKKLINPAWVIDKSVIPDQKFDIDKMYSIIMTTGKISPTQYKLRPKQWEILAWSRSTRYKDFNDLDEMTQFVIDNPDLELKEVREYKLSWVEQRVKVNMSANTILCNELFSTKNYVKYGNKIRKLTNLEKARLQGIPDNFIKIDSQSKMANAIGDSFCLPVIDHLVYSLKCHLDKTLKQI